MHDLLLVELFNVECYRELEMWVRGHSVKIIENNSIRKLRYGFLFTFHITYGRIFSDSEIFSVKEWPDLEITACTVVQAVV